MPVRKTEFPGLLIFEPVIFEDDRGYFFESFSQKTFSGEGIEYQWIQDNQSYSKYGVVRGLHYQNPPNAQAKLVRVLQGRIWDVAVDIRKGSPTYAQNFGIELSAENNLQLLIPVGFAHGFSVLSNEAVVLYKCNYPYNKQSEGGIVYNDPVLNIDWKIPTQHVIVSPKDLTNPRLEEAKNGFVFE